MVQVSILDPEFSRAYWNAHHALPVGHLETPRQYGQRWCEAYRCRPDPRKNHCYIFDREEDYAWFMLRWS